MMKNINELKHNPINPRKITKDMYQKLKWSILLFPKMLMYRDFTLAEDGSTVLCGNQRLDVLNDILNSTPVDWMLSLDDNNRWKSYSPTQQERLIDYWKQWVENPEVHVTIAKDLSEEEEKELTAKDNFEFGEYDYDKLTKMYDEVTLVGFGFKEELFYKPEEDDTVIKKTSLANRGRKINVLVFGGNSIAVTKKEYAKLVETYDNYVDENSVDFGFIRYLLSQKKYGDNQHN